jgi:mono/diheme cytochrome c family protein
VTRWVLCALAMIGGLSVGLALAAALYLASVLRGGVTARDEPSALEARFARLARRLATPARARALENPVAGTPDVLADARAHWADHCATCHANDGSGDTQMGRNLYPKAPDMRRAATQSLGDGELYYIIKNGIRMSGMPAWGPPTDDDTESWALVAFIRYLPKATEQEIEQMKMLNPKSRDEWREEEDEERFLRGEETRPSEPAREHRHQE